MQPHFVNFATSTPKRIIKVSILTKKTRHVTKLTCPDFKSCLKTNKPQFAIVQGLTRPHSPFTVDLWSQGIPEKVLPTFDILPI